MPSEDFIDSLQIFSDTYKINLWLHVSRSYVEKFTLPFAGWLRSASIDLRTGAMTGRGESAGAISSPLIVAIQDDQMTPTIRNPDM